MAVTQPRKERHLADSRSAGGSEKAGMMVTAKGLAR